MIKKEQFAKRITPSGKNIVDKVQRIPDPKLHQLISFIKSGVRILGYIAIPISLTWATALLIVSEVIGIIEELV